MNKPNQTKLGGSKKKEKGKVSLFWMTLMQIFNKQFFLGSPLFHSPISYLKALATYFTSPLSFVSRAPIGFLYQRNGKKPISLVHRYGSALA
ncbi:hypothetical protein LguiB_016221 [Lonicera macranthoides]